MISFLMALGILIVIFGLSFLVNMWFYKSDFGTLKRRDYRKWRGLSADESKVHIALILWSCLVGISVGCLYLFL